MARPKSPSPRIYNVTASLNREERDLVEEKISRAGLRKSEALRLLLLSENLPAEVKIGLAPGAAEAYTKLAPLQSNLNQIAAHLNKNAGQVLGILTREEFEVLAGNLAKTYHLVRDFRQEIIGAATAARG